MNEGIGDGHRPFGPIATRVLSENERVRIWEMVLAPGQRSATHEHRHDYLVVVVEGERVAVEPEPDSTGEQNELVENDGNPGDAVFFARCGPETLVNIGSVRYRDIEIELR